MASAWHVQFTHTVRRNLFLKLRDGSQTVQEVFLPVYIILLLILVKIVQPEISQQAVPMQSEVDATCQPVDSSSKLACWRYPTRPLSEKILAFVPDTHPGVETLVKAAIKEIGEIYPSTIPSLSAFGFSDEDRLLTFYKKNPGTIYAAVIFDNVIDLDKFVPSDLVCRIRINGSYLPSMRQPLSSKDECRPPEYSGSFLSHCQSHKYMTSGFLAIQTAISHAATAMAINRTECSRASLAVQMPLPPYHRSFSSSIFEPFSAVYFVFAMSPWLYVTLTNLVREKQTLLKDCMLTMGLQESVYWLSWMATFALMSGVTSGIITLAAKVLTLFYHSSLVVVFLVIYAYSLSLIALASFLSTIYTKVSSASVVAGVLTLLGAVSIFPIVFLHLSTFPCLLLSLFSPAGFSIAIDTITRSEGSGEGAHWNSFFSLREGVDPGDASNPLSLGLIFIMFLLDTILYLLAAWYLDNVWPHPERGPKRKWHFILQKKYWFPSSFAYSVLETGPFVTQRELDDHSLAIGPSDDNFDCDPEGAESTAAPVEMQNSDVESVGATLSGKAAVVASELRKAYPIPTPLWRKFLAYILNLDDYFEDEIVVVRDLSLTFYEGQSCAIVGHSASGKTTIMRMLSGQSLPDDGWVTIHGTDLLFSGSTQSLGVCPSSNFMAEILTSQEQLYYFASIKGTAARSTGGSGADDSLLSPSEATEEMLTALGLQDVADQPAGALSAPQQRKLCLGLALIGNPKVLLLDEPTKGLDPVSANQVWELISQQKRKGTAVVFTTNDMEEADVMAERKAIISHGRLKCCGSSLFLRKRFGLNHLLHVEKGDSFNEEGLSRLVKEHLPEADVLADASDAHQMTFTLPILKMKETKDLLGALLQQAPHLGLTGGALQAVTLKEVFEKLKSDSVDEAALVRPQTHGTYSDLSLADDDMEAQSLINANSAATGGLTYSTRLNAFKRHFLAFLSAKYLLYRRGLISAIFTFGLPFAIALAGVIFAVAAQQPPPLARAMADSYVGNRVPVLFSSPNSAASPLLSSMLDKMGPLHQKMAASNLVHHFNSSPANSLPNGPGISSVGLHFTHFNISGCQVDYSVIFHPWHIHQLPSLTAMVDNFIHQAVISNLSATAGSPGSLLIISHPLPHVDFSFIFGYLVAAMVSVGILMVPPVFAAQVVSEVEFKMRPMLRVSGLSSAAFWCSTFIADIIPYSILGIAIMTVGLLAGRPPFLLASLPAVLALFLASFPALTLASYVLSFSFANSNAAASILNFLFLLAAMVPFFLIQSLVDTSLFAPVHALLSLVDPPYALMMGLYLIANADIEDRLKEQRNPPAWLYFTWGNHLPAVLLGLAGFSLVALVRLWHLEDRFRDPQALEGSGALEGLLTGEEDTDDEVAKEKEKVQSSVARWDAGTGGEADLVLCNGMSRCQVPLSEEERGGWVLRNLWLAVQPGEVVVLLANESSQRSAALECLSGFVGISFGDALLGGTSVRYGCSTDLSLASYLPAGEILYSRLTLRENLRLFASIKNLPDSISPVLDELASTLKIGDSMDVLVEKCKPAVVRRLSLAIALLGSPSVLLLDEPTRGLDMDARRNVWSLIRKHARHRAVLLSTSSVEEAEAVGSRVGILVNGSMKCLGTPLQLKQKYGSSYSLTVSVAAKSVGPLSEFLGSVFPRIEGGEVGRGSRVDGEATVKYNVPICSLKDVYGLLEGLESRRGEFGVSDYVLSQPTLQEIVLRLSRGDC